MEQTFIWHKIQPTTRPRVANTRDKSVADWIKDVCVISKAGGRSWISPEWTKHNKTHNKTQQYWSLIKGGNGEAGESEHTVCLTYEKLHAGMHQSVYVCALAVRLCVCVCVHLCEFASVSVCVCVVWSSPREGLWHWRRVKSCFTFKWQALVH